MLASVAPIEARLDEPGTNPGECYDMGAPFAVHHAGKLAINSPSVTVEPPRNHCVVTLGDNTDLFVLRYTPFSNNPLSSLDKVTSSVDLAAEIHERHLDKLQGLDLVPWFTDMRTGTPAIDARPGIFIMQHLLPPHADLGLSDNADRYARVLRLSQYLRWVEINNEPAYLYDLDDSDQYSKIDSEIVLHDVEPLYRSRL